MIERKVFPSLLCISEVRSAHLGWRREKSQTDAVDAFSWKFLIHLDCRPWKSSPQVRQNFPTVSKAACWGFIAGGVIDTEAATHNRGVTLEVTDNQMETELRWLWPTAAEWKLWRILKLSNLNGSLPLPRRFTSPLFADCLTFLSRGTAAHAAAERGKKSAKRAAAAPPPSHLCAKAFYTFIMGRFLKLGCYFQAASRAARRAHSALWGTLAEGARCSQVVLETVVDAPGTFSLFSN